MRRIALCLFALAVVGAGVDCGGDSGPPLTAEEFATQANAICTAADAKLGEVNNLLKAATDPEGRLKVYLEHVIPNERSKLKEIGKLNPPNKDKANVEKMLTVGRKAVDRLAEGLKKQGVAYKDDGAAELVNEFNTKARELNLKDCAPKS